MMTNTAQSLLIDNKFLEPREAAEALEVKTETLQSWRCSGRNNLPYVKIGGKVRYKAYDIQAFIDRNTKTHSGMEV